MGLAIQVPVGSLPDQRAWDAVAVHRETALTIRIDAETRIADRQRILRRTRGKSAAGTDGADGRVVLVVRDTARNRQAIRSVQDILAVEFPVRTRRGVMALRRGSDPGGDALLVIRRQGRDRPGDD